MKNNKSNTRQGLDRLGRYRQYFIAGHSRWFVFIIALIQFGLIFYNLAWIRFDFIPNSMKNELAFFSLWLLLYIPGATIFGYWDLTRGTFKAETEVSLEVNPIWKKHFKELKEIKRDLAEIRKELNAIRKQLKEKE